MWKSLTIHSIKWIAARSRKRRVKRFVPFESARSVVVFAEPQGAQRILPQLQALAAAGKKITLYHFTLALKQTGILFPGIDTVEIALPDLCWGHTRPKNAICNEFLSLNADVLIDLTLNEQLPVVYLSALSQAPMQLGLKKETLVPADMMIQQEADKLTSESLLQNLLFYWKNIAVKNNNS